MLPSFSPTGATIQNHIHLGVVPYDGSNPVGFGLHGEPPYQFSVTKRVPKYEAFVSGVRAWNGKYYVHSLRNADNTKPIVFTDMQYTLKIDPTEFLILEAMQKQEIYLVDNYHCANSENHTPFVKHMWFADFSYDDNLDPLLNIILVTVLFKDMDTVS